MWRVAALGFLEGMRLLRFLDQGLMMSIGMRLESTIVDDVLMAVVMSD